MSCKHIWQPPLPGHPFGAAPACFSVPSCLWPWSGSACQGRQSLLLHSWGIAQPHSSMAVFPQWPYSPALVVSWLLCCELARIPPPTQASSAHWEGVVRQGGIRPSGDLFKGNRNFRPLGLFCPSLLQQQGGWSSCVKRVWPLWLPHTLQWRAFPWQASRLRLSPHYLALSSTLRGNTKENSLEKPSQSSCHLSCLWEPCSNRFGSSAPPLWMLWRLLSSGSLNTVNHAACWFWGPFNFDYLMCNF